MAPRKSTNWDLAPLKTMHIIMKIFLDVDFGHPVSVATYTTIGQTFRIRIYTERATGQADKQNKIQPELAKKSPFHKQKCKHADTPNPFIL